MWCLVNLGALAERVLDRWTYFLTYTATGIAGSLASLAWHPTVVGAGASGAIFGLAGALLNGWKALSPTRPGNLPYASGTAGVAFYWNPANLPQCSANLGRVATALILVFRAGLKEPNLVSNHGRGELKISRQHFAPSGIFSTNQRSNFSPRASELCRRTKGDPSFSEPPSTVCGKDEINCGPLVPTNFCTQTAEHLCS